MSDNNYRDMVPASDKDVKTLKKATHKGENKAVYDVREAKSNSYYDTDMKLFKDLKRDA